MESYLISKQCFGCDLSWGVYLHILIGFMANASSWLLHLLLVSWEQPGAIQNVEMGLLISEKWFCIFSGMILSCFLYCIFFFLKKNSNWVSKSCSSSADYIQFLLHCHLHTFFLGYSTIYFSELNDGIVCKFLKQTHICILVFLSGILKNNKINQKQLKRRTKKKYWAV